MTATVMKTVAVMGHDLFNRHGSVRSVSHQWTEQDIMAGRHYTGERGNRTTPHIAGSAPHKSLHVVEESELAKGLANLPGHCLRSLEKRASRVARIPMSCSAVSTRTEPCESSHPLAHGFEEWMGGVSSIH